MYHVRLDSNQIICENEENISKKTMLENDAFWCALRNKKKKHVYQCTNEKLLLFIIFNCTSTRFILTLSLKEEILFRKWVTILNNIMWSLILVFFFALFLPIQHFASSFQMFPDLWTEYKKKEFYLRKPVLEPGR